MKVYVYIDESGSIHRNSKTRYFAVGGYFTFFEGRNKIISRYKKYNKFIKDKRNIDFNAEKVVYIFYPPFVPSNAKCVADCTLNTACCGGILLCNGRIEHLGHGIDNVTVLDGKKYRRAEILVALDVGRNAYLMYYSCYLSLKVGRTVPTL